MIALRNFIFVLFFFILSLPSKASRIEKAYDALKEYNYFKAKKLFEKSLRKKKVEASFGLATIYFRSDNPFHNNDSALYYILLADQSYSVLDEKGKTSFNEVSGGKDYMNILLLRAEISSEFYKKVTKENTIEAYEQFIVGHPWANELYKATHLRDSIAFGNALKLNTSAGLKEFLEKYPYSEYYNKARFKFQELQYSELTKAESVTSYLEFISKCPESPYVRDAEDKIYQLIAAPNTIEAYSGFVKSYPTNRNVGFAWRKIYQLYMNEFSEDRIDQFRNDYPYYPYVEELEVDVKNFKQKLLPFNKGEQYGYMDYNGNVVIGPSYDQAGFFREGLASVMKDGFYGFIDKGNKLIIPYTFNSVNDFEKGRSVVEKGGKFGMIDRSGNKIFPIEFDDLGSLSEGLAFGKKDSLYGYYDADYNLRLTEKYTDAFSFIDGFAKIQTGENQAYIDQYGTYAVAPGYKEIDFYNDTLLIFEEEGLYGIMKRNCQIVVKAQFDKILKPTLDRSLFVQGGKIGYMDLAGNTVIPAIYETFPNYAKRGQFASNFTIVKLKGKYGVIDKNGKIVLPASFNDLGDVSSLMAYTKGKGWGFTDLLGKIVVQPSYSYAESFKDGAAIVELNGLQGLIDQKGNFLIPMNFKAISRLNKELLLVYDGTKYGVLTSKGDTVLAVVYEDIRLMDKEFLVMTINQEVQYLYLPEKRIIQPIEQP